MTASARQRLPVDRVNKEVPPLLKLVYPSANLAIPNRQPLRWPSALSTLSSSEELENRTGVRPQCPGNQFRAHARHLEHPPAIHPRESPACRWLCRNHSARSGTLTFSLNPLSARLLLPAIQKTSPLVQNLWTLCLPCGSPRKTKNKFRRGEFAPSNLNTHTPSRNVYAFTHKCIASPPTNVTITQK